MIDLYNNPNFVVDADGSGMAGLRDGSINAIFTGSWDAASIQEILATTWAWPPCPPTP